MLQQIIFMHPYIVANLKIDKRVYWHGHDLLQFKQFNLNNKANTREARRR